MTNTRTLSDVATYVKRQFGDESGVQIEDSDIVGWTNDALTEIVSKNKVLKARSITTTITGQAEYTKPSDSLEINAVSYDGVPLKATGFDNFMDILSGSSGGYPVLWTQYGDDIILGPTPDNSTSVLTIFYIKTPDPVTVITDFLGIPDRYFERVCEFVMSKSYGLDEDWTAFQAQRQSFEDNLATLGEAENVVQGPFLATIPYEY